MGLGNRRFLGAAVAGGLLVLVMTGCSASAVATSVNSSDGVTIGLRAIGFTGWVASAPCPAALQQELQTDLPTGTALSALNPALTSGPISAPQLTQRDVASCAFSIHIPDHNAIHQFYFLGMDAAAESVIKSDLQGLGYAAESPVQKATGVEQIFTLGTNNVVVSDGVEDGEHSVIVSG